MNCLDRSLLLLLLLLTVREAACSEWSYEDIQAWGQLYPECRGNNQSPIDINNFSQTFYPPIVFSNYGLTKTMVENNGHTLDVKVLSKPGFQPQVSGGGLPGTYLLDAFHFHWGTHPHQGAEHLLEGCSFPGELHLVHYKQEYGTLQEALKYSDGVAVLAIWLTQPQTEPHLLSNNSYLIATSTYQYLSRCMGGSCQYMAEHHAAGTFHWLGLVTPDSRLTQKKITNVILRQLLPFDVTTFYRYRGSLTTPPCTESVVWTVFHQPVVVPQMFLLGLRLLLKDDHSDDDRDVHASDHNYLDNQHQSSQDNYLDEEYQTLSNNFRPPQPLGPRYVFYSGDTSKWKNLCRAQQEHSDLCLAFPKVVLSVGSDSAGQEQPQCHLASPVNLHLGVAKVVQSSHLIWNRLGSCQVVSVVNNGHVLMVRYAGSEPQWEMVGGTPMHLAQMIFRWNSEHQLDSRSFPLEVQLVHYNPKYKSVEEALKKPDGVIIVAKLFQEPLSLSGDWHFLQHDAIEHIAQLSHIIDAIQDHRHQQVQQVGSNAQVPSPDVRLLMGDTSLYYEYRGSFPHAPCSSSVTWIVLHKTGHVSRQQVEALRTLRALDGSRITSNARPLQPLKHRQVLLRVSTSEVAHKLAIPSFIKDFVTDKPLHHWVWTGR